MPEDITCRCPSCNALLGFLPAYAGKMMPCPKCGNAVLVPDPDKEAERLQRRKIFKVLQVVGLIALCWGITIYLGEPALRRELHDVVVPLKENFRSVEWSIRSPLPFVISFRVKATGAKANYEKATSTSEILIDSTFTRYYIWFIRYKREVRFRDDPFFLSWIWLF